MTPQLFLEACIVRMNEGAPIVKDSENVTILPPITYKLLVDFTPHFYGIDETHQSKLQWYRWVSMVPCRWVVYSVLCRQAKQHGCIIYSHWVSA